MGVVQPKVPDVFILNFHGLGEPRRELAASEMDCWLDSPVFETILDRVQGRQDVRITFDDANESDYSIALPLLNARKLSAQFFIVAARIGQKGFLSADQISTLRAAGMGLGSHGMSHRNWRRLGPSEVREELIDAKDAIEQVIGFPITEAAIPYGAYDRGVLKRLHQFGYDAAYNSDGGPASLTSWLRPRNTVRRSHDLVRTLRSITEIPSGIAKLRRDVKLLIKRWR